MTRKGTLVSRTTHIGLAGFTLSPKARTLHPQRLNVFEGDGGVVDLPGPNAYKSGRRAKDRDMPEFPVSGWQEGRELSNPIPAYTDTPNPKNYEPYGL